MRAGDLEKKLLAYTQACRKGSDWLLRFLNRDGSIGPVEDSLYYYRVPWSFAMMGEIRAGSRVLDWIQERMFTPEGAFAGVTPQGVFESRYGSYPLACLIVGAALLRRWDIVYPGTQSLLTWQDPESGGMFNTRQDMTATGEQELFPTAQAGMTFLVTGQIQAARKAGQWLQRLRALQPDFGHRMYSIFSRAKGLVMDYPPDQQALCVTRKDDPYQHHFNGGIAAAFLAQLYMATQEKQWLDLAREYQTFSMTTDECQFQVTQTVKSAWGSGLLYLVTREQQYLDWTVRLGDWIVGQQLADGHWENTKLWTPNPTLADNIAETTEFVMHTGYVIASLAVGG